ncbi:oxidoreductase [Vibrio vulnificus]|uniref:oxidoreductase n=1 Tax=Vibrio vulnificus TaxID=672 RepID=UPI00102A2533|nr:oxidoreductase [Vibrio vulnificus]EGQ7996635.1 oxidoreductase [Vibrio vulnificus]RZP71730.1 oxidoreductase [Vibrio vulnificus]RZP71815.1 oxidoreductase [Vibrio vulnificus]RZQ09543.1 oxidoreductase [Vibrio vulnificus]
MNFRKLHALHSGELAIQKRLNTPDELTKKIPDIVEADMPHQHAEFYSELPYLPLATLDGRGRPWADLLVTQAKGDPSIGIKVTEQNRLSVVAEVSTNTPFVRALVQANARSPECNRLFAGVGIDFSNRRRNKLAGTIDNVGFKSSSSISLNLSSTQHLGNCPKYITIRALEYHGRSSETIFDHYETLNISLPDSSKQLIGQASTAFLATKHTSMSDSVGDDKQDMGLNHRGGTPGFVRLYEDIVDGEVTTYLVMPDHSGNRFYQSIGNIQTNKQVGLTFPDFNTGDLLYLTGDAENLFDEEAELVMPRVNLLTRIRVTGAVHIRQGLNLKMVSDEQLSPYNPPIRYLKHELEQMGRAGLTSTNSDVSISATLESVKQLTTSVSTFTFQLSELIEPPVPGGFGIFDFSGVVDSGYLHMNDSNPQSVNDDFIRTWTISSAANFNEKAKQFNPVDKIDVTVKRKPDGLISNILHENTKQRSLNLSNIISPNFSGTGGGFSCFSRNPEDGLPSIPPQMLWIAGGVGITPFMAMWDGILNVSRAIPDRETLRTDIVLLFSGRDDDMNLLRHFLAQTTPLPNNVCIKIFGYQSISTGELIGDKTLFELEQEFSGRHLEVEQRRVRKNDFENIEHLSDREVFLCGPDSLLELASTALHQLGGADMKIHQESYFF